MRLRSVALRATFLETIQAAFGAVPTGRGKIERVKYTPRTRRVFWLENSLKSARVSRNLVGIEWPLDSKCGTSLAAAASEDSGTGLGRATDEKSVCSGSLALFWLVCSFHRATIPFLKQNSRWGVWECAFSVFAGLARPRPSAARARADSDGKKRIPTHTPLYPHLIHTL